MGDVTSSPYLTVPEVAAILRCHEKTVRRMIRRGEFRAEYVAGRWLVRECDLPGFMPPRRPGPGRPRRQEEGVTMAAARALLAARDGAP